LKFITTGEIHKLYQDLAGFAYRITQTMPGICQAISTFAT
jgi:hypothetical protein